MLQVSAKQRKDAALGEKEKSLSVLVEKQLRLYWVEIKGFEVPSCSEMNEDLYFTLVYNNTGT